MIKVITARKSVLYAMAVFISASLSLFGKPSPSWAGEERPNSDKKGGHIYSPADIGGQLQTTSQSRELLTQPGFLQDLATRKGLGDLVYVRKDTVTIYCSSLMNVSNDPLYIHRYCYDRDYEQSSNNPEPGYQDPPPLSCNPGDVLFAFQALPDTSQTVNAVQEELGMNTGFGVARRESGGPFAVSLVSALDGTSSNPVKLEVERYAVCIRTSRLNH